MTTEFNTPFVEADLRKAANDLDGYNNEMLDLINDEYLQDERNSSMRLVLRSKKALC